MDFISGSTINIIRGMDNWGPYKFEIPTSTSDTKPSGAIPYGSTISSVAVKAYSGVMSDSSDPDDFTEITELVIDPHRAPAINAAGDTISVWFCYPGEDYAGKITLRFTLTLNTGAVRPLLFTAVYCR